MAVTISKIVALVLAVAYVIIAGVGEGLPFAATVAVGVLLPLACIWFAEPLGELDRRVATVQPPYSPSPAWLVATLGWVLLVGIPLFVLIEALIRGK